MSLLPSGDRGQRYEVTSTGYPGPPVTKEGENFVIGWSESKEGAEKMAAAIRLHPSCTSTTVRDRWGKELNFTQYSGVLR